MARQGQAGNGTAGEVRSVGERTGVVWSGRHGQVRHGLAKRGQERQARIGKEG
uniref:Uncharacterized protein n=1 Tax=Siphoviridae sp. ctHn727 TaxID=2825425 RepID=A0A8S5V876_9CAUD|nr:MAG TPA: hypothetical protein [Siphoviridae sp. ctHn727]